MILDKRRYLKINSIKVENEFYRTFTFKHYLDINPGQFIMLTDLEHGEKPFSISDKGDDYFSITVKRVGKFTENLFKLKEKDSLIIRGAYGSPFTDEFNPGDKVLIVGGGCGVAPLRFLAKHLHSKKLNITFINASKTKREMIFNRVGNDYDGRDNYNNFVNLEQITNKLIYVTDDGSFGEKGNAIDLLKKELRNNDRNSVNERNNDNVGNKERNNENIGNNERNNDNVGNNERNNDNNNSYKMVYVAGPELMLKSAVELLSNVNIDSEFLLERYMKCAMGICGQCTIDPVGVRVCVEGPVFDIGMMLKLTEFGNYKRNKAGNLVYF